jgi:hypothetical protein
MSLNKTIYFSNDFRLLKESPTQRDYHSFKKIKEFMERDGFWFWKPIVVKPMHNGKHEIVDGHHRFSVAKELGTGFYYVICTDVECDIIKLNDGVNIFSRNDYLKVHVSKAENKNYDYLYSFINRCGGIPVTSALRILVGYDSQSVSEAFKSGNLKINKIDNVENIVFLLNTLKKYVTWGNQCNVVEAIDKMIDVKEFSAKRLATQINKNPSLLKKCVTRRDYILMFEHIYNYNKQQSDKLRIIYAIDDTDKKFR